MHDPIMDGPTFVLTLGLDANSFAVLQEWRTNYFPRARNHLPAHLTLFHTLSQAQIDRLQQHWEVLKLQTPPPVRFAAVRSLGSGVAIDVVSPAASALRERLLATMAGEFTRQDRQPWRAHVTVQNKVSVSEAKRTLELLRSSFEPWEGTAVSLLVWEYLGGPWGLRSEHTF